MECDCGYVCQGDTVGDRVSDGQRHAREAHGIEVTPDQILTAALAAQPEHESR